MERRRLVSEPVQRRPELRFEREERGLRPALGLVAGLVCEVELRPVARRQADRLRRGARERSRERGAALPVERSAFTQLERSLMVRDADEDELAHEKWVTGRARRAMATSRKPASTRYAARRPRRPVPKRSARYVP